MKLQSAQFAEVFDHMRDHAKPVSQQDAADLAAVRAPMPPSKAHLKRLERHRNGVRFVQPVPTPRELTPETILARQHMDFHKQMLAQIGGTRTVRVDEPLHYDPNAKRFFTHLASSYASEHEVQLTPEQKEAKRVAFAAGVANAKAVREAEAASKRAAAWTSFADAMSGALDTPVA